MFAALTGCGGKKSARDDYDYPEISTQEVVEIYEYLEEYGNKY